MSKLGRNRKGRGHGAQKTNWKPAEAKLEVRYAIITRKSAAGVEYTTYKPMIMPKQ